MLHTIWAFTSGEAKLVKHIKVGPFGSSNNRTFHVKTAQVSSDHVKSVMDIPNHVMSQRSQHSQIPPRQSGQVRSGQVQVRSGQSACSEDTVSCLPPQPVVPCPLSSPGSPGQVMSGRIRPQSARPVGTVSCFPRQPVVPCPPSRPGSISRGRAGRRRHWLNEGPAGQPPTGQVGQTGHQLGPMWVSARQGQNEIVR